MTQPNLLVSLEQLEALTGCDEHLQFAIEVIAHSDISESIRAELHQQIDRIQQRRQDPYLYLAIVGEFSSGKSTLINALLRDDLLKTSALVATTAATRLRHGNDLIVETSFKGSRPGILKTKKNAKQITVPWLAGVDGIDTRHFIHVVTSQDEVAKEVASLTIYHPASFLANNIVIIDTPGTNATNPKHGAITRRIIESEADAAVVVIPATTPLSQTLVNFLADSLHPFLHRCIFVVTKMDQIRKREQKVIIENIENRLKNALGIKKAVIFAAAPQIIIDDLTGEEDIPEHLLLWQDRFSELETLLQQRLRRERILSIAENVLRLLTRLLEQLEGYLLVQWEQYETCQATIKSETIQDLNSFAIEQHRVCRRMIEKAISKTAAKISVCIAEHQEKTRSNIHNAISDVNNLGELDSVVQTKAEALLKEGQQCLQNDLQGEFEKLSQAAQKAELYFDGKFFEAYRRLQALGKNWRITIDSRSSSVKLNTSDVFTSMQSCQSELDEKDGKTVMKGGATGAVIGSLILPGVGTVVGGVVGFFLSGFFMPSLDERKQKIWEQLYPNLDTYFDVVRKQAQEAMQIYARKAMVALDQQIDQYIKQYKAVVDVMLEEQREELQRLHQLQASTKSNLSEIERRKKALSAQQQRLAEITV
ncbi:dynamin family protein [Coleofasciculus sp.]|uniref:dynamin family protein n=1 Tax=Coleofasciculus sp. TaxID=3100458 RepID=UPI0039F78EE5